jgi:protocatechuate 3,4-dioxygenase beta subunit
VEIWQCDANGRYHHLADRRDAPLDDGFQGYGQYVTGTDGGYRFRTIRPVRYPGRTPHIHFKLSGSGFGGLTTQMYVAGEPRNARDGVLNRIPDEQQRAAVIVEFLPDTLGGAELEARFDIVLAADGRFETQPT